MKSLFFIPARGGSKGIPGKNIKFLGGKPLISYSIEMARNFVSDEDICVSTDSDEIIKVVENVGLKVPFKRPDELATDTSSSYDAIMHAIDWYESNGKKYDTLIVLQPTSPFRLKSHLQEALSLFDQNTDMVVSVKELGKNIRALYFTDREDSFIQRFLPLIDDNVRRQDAEKIYELNGSIYVINVSSIKHKKINELKRLKKIVMPQEYSVDIDNEFDWVLSEFLLLKGVIEVNK